ncbi:hypothetical protein GPECTOR_835g68 [Gonium pectorale]|uniref:Uncharacterized protein n=1 Tax=Gonium pectorale TaxID=33097 RepID=A0A150FTZ1_GONPE|nr:hypothetical protein GPECTOR_835g68 [Gonium pectorale]|eukprot:KXZ41081.1 hypothetical protein GPECTOR_835g68 [Gonium pectorale]
MLAPGLAPIGLGSSRGHIVPQATAAPATSTSSTSAIRFRPCIDIHKGKVKQIVGSTLKDLPDAQGGAAELKTNFVKLVGRQRLVLDLSCRKRDGQYWVVTDRWQRFSSLALSESSLAALAASCDEFLVHGVDVEGMQLGIDEELVGLLGAWSPLPVTYAGGARTLEDLERVRLAGRGRVDITVGSALDIFGGKLPYQEVVAWHTRQQQQQTAAH